MKKRILLCLLAVLVAFSGIVCLNPKQVSAADSTGKKIVVSMGDSYSSGEGIEPFFGQDKSSAEKVEDEDWLAHRSEKVWSGMLVVDGQKMVHNDNWFFVAASGAETEQLAGTFEKKYNYDGLTGKKDLAPQLDVFDEVEKKYGKGAVDYVTISIGGNDVGFGEIMITAITSPASLEEKMSTIWNLFQNEQKDGKNTIPSIRESIKNSYKAIEEKAGKQATIIVVGYPRLFSAAGFSIKAGFMSFNVTPETAAVINAMSDTLNEETAKIVEECKAEGMNIIFVPVTDEFSGHEAYTDDPYLNEVVLSYMKEDINQDPSSMVQVSSYSLHPNENGAKAYAKAVQKAIDGLNGSSGNQSSDKPVISVTSKKGKVTVKWDKVDGATKYKVVEYVNGKAKTVKSTKKNKVTIKKVEVDSEHTYAVKAYVNKKWTKIKDSDKVTVTVK
ncbi:MAG: hypothetical protein K6E47_15935 [Lachnospiraceae bacterium]|nr:hypothetical protein [Lachnospiraceae bacterium]